MALLPDAIMASVFAILGILGILLSLSLILRHTAAGPKDTRFA